MLTESLPKFADSQLCRHKFKLSSQNYRNHSNILREKAEGY